MGNDGMENEEKKQSKHIYEIHFSLTCPFLKIILLSHLVYITWLDTTLDDL